MSGTNVKAMIVEAIERYTAAKAAMREAVAAGASDQTQTVACALECTAEDVVVAAIRAACGLGARDNAACGVIIDGTAYLAGDFSESDLHRNPNDTPMPPALHLMPAANIDRLDAVGLAAPPDRPADLPTGDECAAHNRAQHERFAARHGDRPLFETTEGPNQLDLVYASSVEALIERQLADWRPGIDSDRAVWDAVDRLVAVILAGPDGPRVVRFEGGRVVEAGSNGKASGKGAKGKAKHAAK